MPLVQRVLHRDIDDLLTWDHGPLAGGFSQEHGESYGIYRFHGHAQTADARSVPDSQGHGQVADRKPGSHGVYHWQRGRRSSTGQPLIALLAADCAMLFWHCRPCAKADEDVWLY
ncbi:MAG: hypothetical protein R2854_20000 [Caldilineaceae bacterium]